jgi:hypothetical protein
LVKLFVGRSPTKKVLRKSLRGTKKPQHHTDMAPTNKMCSMAECNTKPNFGFAGDTHPTACLKHKEVDMVDVVHKGCSCAGR